MVQAEGVKKAMKKEKDMGLAPRICEGPGCGKEFQPNTAWQRFHDTKCRNKSAVVEHQQAVKLLRAQVRL